MELTREEIPHTVTCYVENYEEDDDQWNSIKTYPTTITIDEDIISSYIYTHQTPDVDLIIRPSGEFRLSNFLVWQSAYAEFWYSDILWPDFTSDDLDKAILDFAKRNRRFGGV